MRKHAVIWCITALILLSTALIGVLRYTFLQTQSQKVSDADQIKNTIALLEKDATVWKPATQSAVRASATLVERNQIKNAQGYYILAVQYQREHNINAAEALFKRAIAVDPQWSWPYAGLGVLLSQHSIGRTEEAKAMLQKAIQFDPNWGRPHNTLAVIFRLEGDLVKAEEEAKRALALSPNDIAAHNNYANLLISEERYDEAEKHYRMAIKNEPEHPKPYYNLACLYSRQKRKKEALAFLEQAIKRAPVLRRDATKDPDLAYLQEDPNFKRLIYGASYPSSSF